MWQDQIPLPASCRGTCDVLALLAMGVLDMVILVRALGRLLAVVLVLSRPLVQELFMGVLSRPLGAGALHGGPVQARGAGALHGGPGQARGAGALHGGPEQAQGTLNGAGPVQALAIGTLSQPSPEKSVEELRLRIMKEAEESFVREAKKLRGEEGEGVGDSVLPHSLKWSWRNYRVGASDASLAGVGNYTFTDYASRWKPSTFSSC